MFMVSLRSRCHVPNSKGPVAKTTDKEIFLAATTLFAFHKNNTSTKVTVFPGSVTAFNFSTSKYVALMSLGPHDFAYSPFCY